MMTSVKLSALSECLNATLINGDALIQGVSTDTRNIHDGDLFIALKGERFDAHDFAAQAIDSGAVALVVDHPLALPVPQLVVDDTRIALGLIGEYNRAFFTGTLIAVTGSSGKTTVKEMLATILSGVGETLFTQGNLNNDIGVPLTLLRLSAGHRYAVIEMGASGPNEIAYSVSLSHPDIAIVNNAMGAHLEGFGSLEGVVEAKGEIYDGLTSRGAAVVNADDPYAQRWLDRAKGKSILTFGLAAGADVRAQALFLQENGCYGFDLMYQNESVAVRLNVLGRHNVCNALAAAAVSLSAGLSLSQIASGLGKFSAVKGRMFSSQGVNGALVLDDSYNANPGSVRAAISMLSELNGERTLVLGDMGELGADEVSLHQEVGQFAAQMGIEKLFAVGRLSQFTVEAYKQAGGVCAEHMSDKSELVSRLQHEAHSAMVILVKGSRSAAMDQVVNCLVGEA
jgi:UDP-N-acetylmuramoyl-tripeptide--D-alanyl-D-alanine ligase